MIIRDKLETPGGPVFSLRVRVIFFGLISLIIASWFIFHEASPYVHKSSISSKSLTRLDLERDYKIEMFTKLMEKISKNSKQDKADVYAMEADRIQFLRYLIEYSLLSHPDNTLVDHTFISQLEYLPKEWLSDKGFGIKSSWSDEAILITTKKRDFTDSLVFEFNNIPREHCSGFIRKILFDVEPDGILINGVEYAGGDSCLKDKNSFLIYFYR